MCWDRHTVRYFVYNVQFLQNFGRHKLYPKFNFDSNDIMPKPQVPVCGGGGGQIGISTEYFSTVTTVVVCLTSMSHTSRLKCYTNRICVMWYVNLNGEQFFPQIEVLNFLWVCYCKQLENYENLNIWIFHYTVSLIIVTLKIDWFNILSLIFQDENNQRNPALFQHSEPDLYYASLQKQHSACRYMYVSPLKHLHLHCIIMALK